MTINDKPKKVLVVDDDQTAVAFVHAALEMEKYEVIGASDGLTGLLRTREELPDLIILDVYMPGEQGFYALRNLKSDSKTNSFWVVYF